MSFDNPCFIVSCFKWRHVKTDIAHLGQIYQCEVLA